MRFFCCTLFALFRANQLHEPDQAVLLGKPQPLDRSVSIHTNIQCQQAQGVHTSTLYAATLQLAHPRPLVMYVSDY